MLPRFLIADNSQELPDKIFVVHTHTPKCIIGGNIENFDNDRSVFWIDKEISGQAFDKLLVEAEEFLENEL
ncbi:MAG TPA: hypothetical protein DCQ31_16770, partial [Bacteroidales bacterium]|nr:hypothetical protein [Bacteroidales bacterium]